MAKALSSHHAVPHPEPHEASAIGWVGLLIPFAIIIIAAVVTKNDAPSQLAIILTLVAIPFGILALRWRATKGMKS